MSFYNEEIAKIQIFGDTKQEQIDKLQKDNKELNLENQALYESINCNDDNMLARRYYKLQKENEELKEQRDNAIKLRNELIEEQKITCISKNEIRNKIKELEKQYKEELRYGRVVLDIGHTIKILKELLGE